MKIQPQPRQTTAITIVLQGEVSFRNRTEFFRYLQNVDNAPTKYIVDMTAVTQFDSSAVALLFLLNNHAEKSHAVVNIKNCPVEALKLFNQYRLSELFEFDSD